LTTLELSDVRPEKGWAAMCFVFLDVSLKLIYSSFPVSEQTA